MTKVEAIEEEIKKLSPIEFAQLRNWMSDQAWNEWDEEFERDVAAGRLDDFFAKAVAEHEAGKTRKL
jgi:hypothetical protein